MDRRTISGNAANTGVSEIEALRREASRNKADMANLKFADVAGEVSAKGDGGR